VGSFSEQLSGADNNRPALRQAIALCLATGAVLLSAKLDRISRNCSFLMALAESKIKFVIAEMPFCDEFSISILACVAAKERSMISERTRAGLAVARSKGVKLGAPPESLASARIIAQQAIQARKRAFAASSIKAIRELQSVGIVSLNKIADAMTKRGEKTDRG